VVVGKNKWQKKEKKKVGEGDENFSRLKASGIFFLFEGKDMVGIIFLLSRGRSMT
jgi:hypothetical protein